MTVFASQPVESSRVASSKSCFVVCLLAVHSGHVLRFFAYVAFLGFLFQPCMIGTLPCVGSAGTSFPSSFRPAAMHPTSILLAGFSP